MDKQTRTRTRGDEPPIIGDHPGRQASSGGSEAWRLDPSDVARHAQLRRRSEQRGALGKVVRYSVLALALAGAFAVYWNFDTLKQINVEAPALSALLKKVSPDAASVSPSRAPDSEKVESTPIVGTAAPTSVSSARERETPIEMAKIAREATPKARSQEAPADKPSPAADASSAQRAPSADGAPAAQAAPVTDDAPAAHAAPATDDAPPAKSAAASNSIAAAPAAVEPAPAPRTPPTPSQPETISFALPKFTVSERDASAAVLVARSGGNRGPSAFTWWTSDGTAKAGSDYVDLGKVVVKLAAGEMNRAIHIPIVGDAIAEGPESFYVNLAPGEDLSAEPQDRVEVVIEDDD